MRLADIATERADGHEDATWALLELFRIKKSTGDLDAAARVLERAAEVLSLERVMPLARDLAERAGRSGNLRLGAELLERLRRSAPADESVWRPLLEHYVWAPRSGGPRSAGGGDAAAVARRGAAKSAAHGAGPVAAGRRQRRRHRGRHPARRVARGAGAVGSAGAAGGILRTDRFRRRSGRLAGPGVRYRHRGW